MINDNYLSCQNYANQSKHSTIDTFLAFYDAASKSHYFSFIDANGQVLLCSEGYPTEAPREKGIQSVLKNKDLKQRYAIIEEKKQFFLTLKAGNHKEIARSCAFKSKAEAEKLQAILLGEAVAVPATTAKKTAIATKPATEKIVTTVKGIAAKVTKTATTSKATTEISDVVVTKVTKVTTTKKATIVLNFLETAEYLYRPTLWDEYGPTGYAIFNGSDNKSYYVVYNPDGSIYLKSTGYATENLRNEALNLVKGNILRKEAYQIKDENGVFFVVLLDEKGNEIARSENFQNFTSAFLTTPTGREGIEQPIVGTLY